MKKISVICFVLSIILVCSLCTSCGAKIDSILSENNYTCEYVVTEDSDSTLRVSVFNDFLMNTPALSNYINKSDNTVHLNDFDLVIRTSSVSASEVYYDMIIRHKESGDIVRTYRLDESNNYGYTRSDSSETYKIITDDINVKTYIEDMKGKTFKSDRNYAKYDKVNVQTDKNGSIKKTTVYGVKLDGDGKIQTLLYKVTMGSSDMDALSMFVNTDTILTNNVYTFSNYGTTVKP